MSLELAAANAVVVAHRFNPSVVSQIWLVKNGIVEEEDFQTGSIFSEMVVQVNSPEFRLLIVPEQCQFAPRVDPEVQQRLVVEKFGSIVRLLPHTPYSAVGLNFIWHLSPEDGDVPALSRELFFVQGGQLYREFEDVSGRFGAYLSKDAFGGRLKLDVKPIIVPREEEHEERIQFAFNFHRDVDSEDNPVGLIEEMFQHWDEAREEASRIVQTAVRERSA